MGLYAFRNVLVKNLTLRKFVIVIIFGSFVFLFYEIYVSSVPYNYVDFHKIENLVNSELTLRSEMNIVDLYYKARESWSTSNLGSILFKNVPYKAFRSPNRVNKKFLVLIWQHWKWLQARHVQGFNDSGKSDPLAECSVRNCEFTGYNSFLNTADAIVVHLQKGLFPKIANRRKEQRWIFLNDESPLNVFSLSLDKPDYSKLAEVFNWSMTYRSDADVPVPYGRTVPLQAPIGGNEPRTLPEVIPHWSDKRRDVLSAVLISNCAVSYRMKYLNELKQYIKVDVHGKCSDQNKTSCPGHFRSDCGLMAEYLFYLVLENSMCQEYLTEKSFYHAYSKGAIPVIMGPSPEDCAKLLPPNSYLHVEIFETPKHLANEMIRISKDYNTLISYHEWRKYFEVVNEHGYFGSKSFHLCRVCEALNYNDENEKVYSEDDLKKFLDPLQTCRNIS